jgi:hypothetical protein
MGNLTLIRIAPIGWLDSVINSAANVGKHRGIAVSKPTFSKQFTHETHRAATFGLPIAIAVSRAHLFSTMFLLMSLCYIQSFDNSYAFTVAINTE